MSEKSGMLPKVAAVAWREFRYTALTKAFIIGVVILPVVMMGLVIVIQPLAMQSTPTATGSLYIVDQSGLVAPIVQRLQDAAPESKTPGAEARPSGRRKGGDDFDAPVNATVVPESDPARLAELKPKLTEEGILGIAVIPPTILEAPKPGAKESFELYVPRNSGWRVTAKLEEVISSAVVEARVKKGGSDYASLRALLSRPDAETKRVGEGGQERRENVVERLLTPVAIMMLLWLSVFVSANQLLTTTIEEKGSKVMEVLLAALSPMQLLAGKLLGQAMVATVMLGMYGSAALVSLSIFKMTDVLTFTQLLWLGVYFVMAYFMIAAMMVAVGSAVSELREAQSLLGPVMVIVALPLMLWMPISSNPGGILATVASFIPPAIPFVMILRLSASGEGVPGWQVAASLVIGYASAYGMLWAATRIFRVGILMQGKPPTPKELLRWVWTR